jgi:hypothetical protein
MKRRVVGKVNAALRSCFGAEIVAAIYPPRLSFFVWLISSFQFNDLMSRQWSQVSAALR